MNQSPDRVRQQRDLAERLLLQAATRLGILDWDAERGIWIELLTAGIPPSPEERAILDRAARGFAERCLLVAGAALEAFDAVAPIDASSDQHSRCPRCDGNALVEEVAHGPE